jgi:hypothetical protein
MNRKSQVAENPRASAVLSVPVRIRIATNVNKETSGKVNGPSARALYL